jgi:hypothetical protein
MFFSGGVIVGGEMDDGGDAVSGMLADLLTLSSEVKSIPTVTSPSIGSFGGLESRHMTW